MAGLDCVNCHSLSDNAVDVIESAVNYVFSVGGGVDVGEALLVRVASMGL